MYKSLQAGRAIAAILVVLFHLGGAMANAKYFGIAAFGIPFSFGSAGVEFFFVLSGFIILTAHRKDIFQPKKLTAYLKKRLIRIYPTYWLVFFTVFSLAILSSAFSASIPHDALVLIKALFLIPQNGNGIGGTGAPVIAVAWTLQYEMFFYLCFAFLILNRWFAIGLALVLGYIYISFSGVQSLPFPLWFLSQDYILLFLMGMIVSELCITKRINVKNPFVYFVVGTTAFLFIALDTVCGANKLTAWSTILYGIASCLIVFGVVRAEDIGNVVGDNKYLQLLGDSSYALYLIHNPLISVLCKVFLIMHFDRLGIFGATLSFVIILFVCLVSSLIFHLYIERPITRSLKRIL